MKNKIILSSLLMIGFLFPLSACKNEESSFKKFDTVTAGEAQQTYIKDIKAVGAYWDKYAYNGTDVLKSKYGQEYSRLSTWNLNCDCGTTTDCIYLYENRTIHAEEAIRDIIAVTQRDIPETFKYNGHDYEVVGGMRVNGLNSSKTEYKRFDLNMNAGGDYIYLCVSRDPTVGKPITSFKVGGYSVFSNNTNYNFIMNLTNTDEYQNFNAGAGGTAIYGAVTCMITGWVINDIDLMDRDINGTYVMKTITLDTSKKTLTEDQLKPFVDKGDGAYFQGYYTKKINSEGEKVDTTTKFPTDNTIWASWTYDITIDFTGLGGTVMEFKNVSKFPSFSEFELYYLVLNETGKKASGGLCWPGAYTAVAY